MCATCLVCSEDSKHCFLRSRISTCCACPRGECEYQQVGLGLIEDIVWPICWTKGVKFEQAYKMLFRIVWVAIVLDYFLA